MRLAGVIGYRCLYVCEPACCGDLVLVHVGEETCPGVHSDFNL